MRKKLMKSRVLNTIKLKINKKLKKLLDTFSLI
jgi:hypothetical protein